MDHFISVHNSARWEEKNTKDKKEDPTWAPLSRKDVRESPINEIVKDIARQKMFYKETELEEVREKKIIRSPPQRSMFKYAKKKLQMTVSDLQR